jgi:hypothetical protein
VQVLIVQAHWATFKSPIALCPSCNELPREVIRPICAINGNIQKLYSAQQDVEEELMAQR